jgi:thiamine kinase-like enzyme
MHLKIHALIPYPHSFCSLYKLNLLSPSASSALPITSLLLRVYGAGTEKLIDRSVELSLLDHLAVHAPEIAPIMYVAFANGRLEQFIEGARALEAADMRLPSTSLLIAQKMARLHSLPLPSSAVPQPAVWDLIRNWLNGERDMLLVEQGVAAAAVLQQRMQTVEEAMALAQQLQPLLHTDATVLCHNDLLCGNILQEIGGDRLYFIDYECAPRAADVARFVPKTLQVWRCQRGSVRHREPLCRVASV